MNPICIFCWILLTLLLAFLSIYHTIKNKKNKIRKHEQTSLHQVPESFSPNPAPEEKARQIKCNYNWMLVDGKAYRTSNIKAVYMNGARMESFDYDMDGTITHISLRGMYTLDFR